MTPSTIQYIVDSFLSSIHHIALYIEHLDITNQVETLVINKKDLVFIELVETEGNVKEDYINNYLLKVELQSDTIIYISPSNITSIQPLTKEQYNRVVEQILGDEKKSEEPVSQQQQEEDNSIELDIDLSEKEEDFPYNPDEAITYITTDIAKLSAHLSTPQVDQNNNNYNNNMYNNKMYNILKKLSKLFKPIQQQNNNYNNNIYTTKGIQKIKPIQQQQQNNNYNNNNILNNINAIKQQQNSSNNVNAIKQQQQNIKEYKTILKQLNLSKTYIQQYQNSLYNIINSLYNIINNISNITKKEIKQQLYNIVDKYKQYEK